MLRVEVNNLHGLLYLTLLGGVYPIISHREMEGIISPINHRGNGVTRGGSSSQGQLKPSGPPRPIQIPVNDQRPYHRGPTSNSIGPPFRGRGWGHHYNQRGRGYNVDHQDVWRQRPSGAFGQQSPLLGYSGVEPEWESNIPTSNSFFPLADRDGPEGEFFFDNSLYYHPKGGANPTFSYLAPSRVFGP